MLYKVYEDSPTYILSYQELKQEYEEICAMEDDEFLSGKNLVRALHLACMISYLKGLPASATVSDEGIVHKLVHILDMRLNNISESEYGDDLESTRELFGESLKLS